MSECNHTFRTEERPARIDCCIHCGALEPVVTIATLQARIEEIIEDIRMACGCTDGDDIRNHLAEYLEGQ